MKDAILPTLLAAVLAIMITACGGGDDKETATASPQASASPTVTRDQLALMPLPASVFGGEFLSLTVDDGSGYQTSDQVAHDTGDPLDSAADIEAAGWVASYKLDYEDATLAALVTGQGAADGITFLDLFKDDQSASAYISKQLADADSLVGADLGSGIKLTSANRFDVTAGDAGFGLTEQGQLGDRTAYAWVSGFRLGSLVASVEIDRADDADQTATMQQLATALDQRVRAVIDGTEQPTPVALPIKEADAPGQGARPDSGPFPDTMALTLDDLPKGSTIDKQGYVPKDNKFSYKRSFDLGPYPDGQGPGSVEVNIEMYPGDASATTYFAGLKGVYLGSSAQDFFEGVFSSQTFQVSNIVASQPTIAPQGDDAFAAGVSYDFPFGPVDNEFAYVLVGRVVGSLAFTSIGADLRQSDVDALMAKLVDRIKGELGTS